MMANFIQEFIERKMLIAWEIGIKNKNMIEILMQIFSTSQ